MAGKNNFDFDHMKDPKIEAIQQTEYLAKKGEKKLEGEYQYFPEEYFTGADLTIYAGDTWLDEVTNLSFSLQENIKPIHGYADYTWRTTARGTRLVQGQFSIAFREAGYMDVVLDHLADLGGKAKPRLAYLMGGEDVPDYIAGIKDNIEDALMRWNGNPDSKQDDWTEKKPDKKESFLDKYEWPLPLKHVNLDSKMRDASKPNTKKRTRHGHVGSISQLQARLIQLGYTWPDWNWHFTNKGNDFAVSTANRLKVQGAPTSKVINTIKPKTGWYMLRTYNTGSNRIDPGMSTAAHPWVKEMQYRLSQYPGKLDGLNMGGTGGTYDGRYGPKVAGGVKLFESLAMIPAANRSKNGDWVSTEVYNELRKGLKVTGVYDTPTMLAVKFFQSRNGLSATGIVDTKTRDKLSPQGTRTIPGETINHKGKSLYNPGNLFEPQASKYEAEIWGRASTADKTHRRRTFFYHRAHNETNKNYLKQNGFDIYITYGPTPERAIRAETQNAKEWSGKDVNFNTTVKAIRNIQITGVTQIIDASGQPIEEVYSFIAQDLD